MLGLTDVVDDPDFQSEFTVIRSEPGAFDNEGEWVTQPPTETVLSGVVLPSKSEDMVRFLPEGERQKNAVSIYCTKELFMGDGNTRQSDVVVWNGNYYKVAFSKPWQDMGGFWFVMATGFVHGKS